MKVEKKRACPYCPNKSFRPDNLKRHMRTFHPNMATPKPVQSLSAVLRAPTNDGLIVHGGRSTATTTDDQGGHAREQRNIARSPKDKDDGPVTDIDDSSSQSSEDEDPEWKSSVDCSSPQVDLHEDWPSITAMKHLLECETCRTKISPQIHYPEWLCECLLKALKRESSGLAQYLIDLGISVDYADGKGDTALHYAIASKNVDLDIVRSLCQEGSCVNVPGSDGFTPLMLACWACSDSTAHREISPLLFAIKLLLEAGADPNTKSENRDLPIHLFLDMDLATWKVDSVFQECLELLVTGTKRLNTVDSDGLTPIHIMVDQDAVSVLDVLIRNGADPSRKDGSNKVALAFVEHPAMARRLLESWSAPIDAWTLDSAEILVEHIKNSRYEILEVLREWNPQIMVQSGGLATPVTHQK